MANLFNAQENIDAIRDYLNRREGELRLKPGGGTVVDNFRTWYRNLSDIDILIHPNKSVGEAKWYRDQANRILGEPDLSEEGWVPADAVAAAETVPPASDPTPKRPLLSGWTKAGLAAGGVLVAWLWLRRPSE